MDMVEHESGLGIHQFECGIPIDCKGTHEIPSRVFKRGWQLHRGESHHRFTPRNKVQERRSGCSLL